MPVTQRNTRKSSPFKRITRAQFIALFDDILYLKEQCRTNLRRCAELQVDVDRLNRRAKMRGLASAASPSA